VDRNDIIDLLTIVQASDNRSVGDPEIVVWHKLLGHLDKDDCTDAILAFRAEEPGKWLEPGHVLTRVRAKIRDRLDRLDQDFRPSATGVHARLDEWGQIDKAIPDADPWGGPVTGHQPASAEVRAAAMKMFADSRALPDEDGVSEDVPYVNPLQVRCEYCRAAVGEPCTMPGMPGKAGNGRPRERLRNTLAHPSRYEKVALKLGFSQEVADVIVAAAQRSHVRRTKAHWDVRDAALAPIVYSPPQDVAENPAQGESGTTAVVPREGES
jgi:hypothetical protein